MITAILCKWLLIGRSKPGVRRLTTSQDAAAWFVDTLLLSYLTQTAVHVFTSPAYSCAALFRLLGAKMGRRLFWEAKFVRSSCDLWQIGDDTAVGGSTSILTQQYVGDGVVEYAGVEIGERCLLGNCLVVNPGVSLSNASSLGAMSTLPAHTNLPEETTWLGNPATLAGTTRDADEAQTLLLQRMVRGEAAREEGTGAAHPLISMLAVCAFPLISIMVVGVLTGGVYLGSVYTIRALESRSKLIHFAVVVCSTLLTFAAQLMLAVAIKRILFPRFVGRTPLWSYKFMAWSAFQTMLITLHDTTMGWVQGTPFMPLWLHLLGGQIGRGVYYDTNVPGEMDNLTLGDGCVVLAGAETFVPHTIDRGALQFAPIALGAHCSIGIGSSMLPLSELLPNASLGPLSIALKGEMMPEGKYAEGSPAVVFNEQLRTSYGDTEEEADAGSCSICCCCCYCCAVPVDDESAASRPHATGHGTKAMGLCKKSPERARLLDDARSVEVDIGLEDNDDSGTDFEDYW